MSGRHRVGGPPECVFVLNNSPAVQREHLEPLLRLCLHRYAANLEQHHLRQRLVLRLLTTGLSRRTSMSGDATVDDTAAGLREVALDDAPPVRSLARAAIQVDSPAPLDGREASVDGSRGDIGIDGDATEAAQAGEAAADAAFSRPDATATNEGMNGDEGFEAISLGDERPPEPPEGVQKSGDGRHHSSTPPSPASPAHTPPSTPPPHSPSVVSTAPTTTIDPSSSQNVSTPPESGDSDAKGAGDADASGTPASTPQKKQVSTRKQTVMQKVVSMTRQRTLPPKSKEEEVRLLRSHLALSGTVQLRQLCLRVCMDGHAADVSNCAGEAPRAARRNACSQSRSW